MDIAQTKITWRGEVVSLQPRSTVWRYLTDNRTHRECGFNIFLKGTVQAPDGTQILSDPVSEQYDFCVAVSEKQEQKLQVRIGDILNGSAWTKKYPETEFADYYRAGSLKKLRAADIGEAPVPTVKIDTEKARYDGTPIPHVNSKEYPGPPWEMSVPPLEIYYDWSRESYENSQIGSGRETSDSPGLR